MRDDCLVHALHSPLGRFVRIGYGSGLGLLGGLPRGRGPGGHSIEDITTMR